MQTYMSDGGRGTKPPHRKQGISLQIKGAPAHLQAAVVDAIWGALQCSFSYEHVEGPRPAVTVVAPGLSVSETEGIQRTAQAALEALLRSKPPEPQVPGEADRLHGGFGKPFEF